MNLRNMKRSRLRADSMKITVLMVEGPYRYRIWSTKCRKFAHLQVQMSEFLAASGVGGQRGGNEALPAICGAPYPIRSNSPYKNVAVWCQMLLCNFSYSGTGFNRIDCFGAKMKNLTNKSSRMHYSQSFLHETEPFLLSILPRAFRTCSLSL